MKETANIDQERKVDPCCFSEMTRFNTMISSAPQKVLSNSCCRFQRRPPFFFFFSLFFFLFYSVGIAFFTADGKRGAAVFFAEGRSEKSDLAIQAPGEGEEEEETATIATGDDGPSSSSSFITFVIYGATGDLSKRKLYPTLFTLYCENQLPEEFLVAGLSNLELSTEDFRELHRPQLE
ncbi:glucose-6-phosphate 1-dehydrogenase [Cystoisospora suis]|uniref:glucose-6-phosphate dehydrogenase (NADP(+)) n=1 Tax=Cystoisospora suis TaxID=483139 RepID=A0A2C6KYC2_9APIC|nr:glucose-6-phosphate 1-dehydrogenase [Cystoisospora suis]